ncbi:MAG: DUF2141 domain-containing protein [Deltaproteobacteria bacterium]|nr:DUF2141 domain-containing protein [Deltaproteobacteria bacterium]
MSNRNRISGFVFALTLVGTVSFAARAPADPPPTSKVVANVGKLRNAKGSVGCRLYRSGAGFPESAEGTTEKRTSISGEVVTLSFESLTPGTYAVSCMHDENDNGKLDKNFLGVPTEGYGVSNNHTYAMSAPKWDESKFVVEAGKDVGLGIGLRY